MNVSGRGESRGVRVEPQLTVTEDIGPAGNTSASRRVCAPARSPRSPTGSLDVALLPGSWPRSRAWVDATCAGKKNPQRSRLRCGLLLLRWTREIGDARVQPVENLRDIDSLVHADEPTVARVDVASNSHDVPVVQRRSAGVSEA